MRSVHRMKNLLWAGTLAAGLMLGSVVTGGNEKELIEKKHFYPIVEGKDPKMFWYPRSETMTFKDGTLELSALDKERESASLKLNVANEIVPWATISFDYKIDNGKGLFHISFVDDYQNWLTEQSLNLDSATWTNARIHAAVPAEAAALSLNFTVIGKSAVLSIKNVSLKLNESRLRIQDGGAYVPCEGIWIAKSADDTEHFDEKAAKTLRKRIEQFYGERLPIRYFDIEKDKVKPGMIILGEAAFSTGLIDKETEKKLKPGGYAVNVAHGCAAVGGKSPSGTVASVYGFLEKNGFVFLTVNDKDIEVKEKKGVLDIKECKFDKSPAFELRLAGSGEGVQLGYTDPDYVGDARLIGSVSHLSCHTSDGFVNFDAYSKEHPEYFAMDRQGKRLHKDPESKRFDIHYCMSNPEVRTLIAQQMANWMRVNPEAKYFYLTFGDGGDMFCKCAECRKMDVEEGVMADRNLAFVNAIAEKVATSYPDKIILTLAYVDTEKPPLKTTPAPNVRVLYCPYPLNWANHLQAFCPENREGIKTLDGWLNAAKDKLYIFDYPSCCGEVLNIWPAFYANYDRIRYYAKNNIKGIVFCGLNSPRYGYSGYNAFNNLSRYVISKVLWDPEVNVEKEIDLFMKLYYGPAAPSMRGYFNLIHKEVKDRNFVQHTEEVKRGFVTKELSQEAARLFAEAEKAVGKDAKFLERVKFEKLFLLYADLSDRCRGNGKIAEDEFPAYAARLAEFATLCGNYKISYFSRALTPDKWLWETALLRTDSPVWYNGSQVKSLIKNPVETMGESVPRCQEAAGKGWNMPMQGIVGGQEIPYYAFNCAPKNNVKVLRRPTSGYGYAMTNLYLEETDKFPVKIEMEGIDNDKETAALMAIVVNGKTIYSGKAPFPKNGWQWCSFDLPAGTLKKGKNLVEFKNITPDKSEDEKYVDFITSKKNNYYWGWFIFAGLKFVTE